MGNCGLNASHPLIPSTAFPIIRSGSRLDTTLNTKLYKARELYSSQEVSPAVKNQITESLNEKSHQTLHQSRQILFEFTGPQNKHCNIGNWSSGTQQLNVNLSLQNKQPKNLMEK